MPAIRLLPTALVNRIAAGEVIAARFRFPRRRRHRPH
jgi:hypothetical protein